MRKNTLRILAALLAAVTVFAIAACGNVPPAETSGNETTPSVTTAPETTGTVVDPETTGATAPIETTVPIPTTPEQRLEDIAKAINVEATPPASTKEIPLLVILANFDANKNGINDYDENDPKKLYTDKSKDYYGEQWASTKPEDHYKVYFGDGLSLTNYYMELSLGAFRYVPIEFDVMPENSPVPNGVISVVVPMKHPTASGDASGCITAVVEACDPYIDFSKYDLNGNNRIDSNEMGIVILNPGADAYSSSKKSGQQFNPGSPRNYFEVWGTSQGLGAYVDDMLFTKVSNMGEYKTVGTILPVGVPAHELAHNLGAEDLYDRKVNGATGNAVSGWPRSYYFSLQSDGSNSGGSATPTYLDPYQRIRMGWAEEQVVEDGIYTIHSTRSGKYKVLRVNTPDPKEYYLIEIRMKESFEKNLTPGTSKGGIMVWHIDEDINSNYYTSGMASSSYASASGVRHDPGIVPLFREGYDEKGKYMSQTNPYDPFYYFSDDPATSVCDTGAFVSPTKESQGLFSYPKTWEGKKNYNVHIEVLSEAGDSMTVKITGSRDGRKDFLPIVSATYSEKSFNSITVLGKIDAQRNADIIKCGILFSTSPDFTENVIEREATLKDGKFESKFEGLTANTKYYYKVYVLSSAGRAEASGNTPTSSAPVEKSYVTASLYSDADARPYGIKISFGKTLVIPEGWLKSISGKKSGYTLEGWYLDKELTKPYDMSKAAESGDSDFNLYAKWVKN